MSELNINLKNINGKTVVSDSFFTSPFKLVAPFYEKNFAKLMIMTATAGVMKGDVYDISVHSDVDSHAVITDQSYSKIFNTLDGCAEQNLKLEVDDNAELVWLPHPVIPFEDSTFYSNTKIGLNMNSKLIFSEITACGRAGMGEKFSFNSFMSRTEIDVNGKPVFIDNNRLVSGITDFSDIGFFEGFAYTGLVYLYGYDKPELLCDEKVSAFVTQAKSGYVVRFAGNSGDALYNYVNRLVGNSLKGET